MPNERFMRHHYGANGFVDALATKPDPRDQQIADLRQEVERLGTAQILELERWNVIYLKLCIERDNLAACIEEIRNGVEKLMFDGLPIEAYRRGFASAKEKALSLIDSYRAEASADKGKTK